MRAGARGTGFELIANVDESPAVNKARPRDVEILFRNRTPNPPPFSPMNSTPVASGARKVAMGRAFSIIPFLSFAEPHAGTSAVFVDELDAGIF